MSVFNVRVGRWSGNPLHQSAWRKASPRFGGIVLIKEVFGQLTSRSAFLNVSDGGHFENLGIYELVRRRCHIVVTVDADCDPDYRYDDLANAIRKCEPILAPESKSTWQGCGPKAKLNAASRISQSDASITGIRHWRADRHQGCAVRQRIERCAGICRSALEIPPRVDKRPVLRRKPVQTLPGVGAAHRTQSVRAAVLPACRTPPPSRCSRSKFAPPCPTACSSIPHYKSV